LRLLSGRNQGSEYVLGDPSELVAGRSSDADLILLEGMVSRRHARFVLAAGVLEVEDLGSTNGTFVNGEKIRKRRLSEGDRVLIGTAILKVVLSEAPLGTVPPKPDSSLIDDAETAERNKLAGDLSEVSVAEVLELFASSQQEALIELTSDERSGYVLVSRGRVVACGAAGLSDAPPTKVMLRLLGLDRGSFAIRAYREPEGEPLGLALPDLLVELTFKLDELQVLRTRLPGPDEPLLLARPMVPLLSALEDADLDVLQLAHNLGRVRRVFDVATGDDLEVARRLLGLVEAGYLRRG
jgi:pSer/pThr/pTyr-binding forkhead associated (FHA) protein